MSQNKIGKLEKDSLPSQERIETYTVSQTEGDEDVRNLLTRISTSTPFSISGIIAASFLLFLCTRASLPSFCARVCVCVSAPDGARTTKECTLKR